MNSFVMVTSQRWSVKLFAVFAVLLLGSFIAQPSEASMSQYRMSVDKGSPTDMSGANVVWEGYQGVRGNYGYSPTYAGYYDIGFNFKFDGTEHQYCVIYTTGHITLGFDVNNNWYDNFLGNINAPTIAPWFNNSMVSGNQSGCFDNPKVSFTTIGSAPNRVFVVQWFNWELEDRYGSRGTFEARLYESPIDGEDGVIEFYYDFMGDHACNYYNYSSAHVGMGTDFSNLLHLSFSGTTPTTTTSGSPATINIEDGKTGSNKPADGALYTFVKLPNVQLSSNPKLLNFGQVSGGATADLCVTVRHAGTEGALTFTPPSIVGSSAYTIISSPSSTPLDPGQTAVYCIRFAPLTNGTHVGVLTISSNGLDSGSQQILLTGDAIAPTIEVIPIGDNFKDRMFRKTRVRLGDTVEQGMIVKNIGAGVLVLDNTSSIAGEFSEYYWISRFPDAPLTPDASDTIFLKFSPRQEGLMSAQLTLRSNASNGDQRIGLVGVGIIPRIVVNPDPMKFDSVQMGTIDTMKFTICNPGSDTLRLLKNYMSGGDVDFSLVPLSGADLLIAPEKCREVSVIFRPRQMGTRVARFAVQTNIPFTFDDPRRDTATSVLYYDITGTGVPIGTLSSADIRTDGIVDSTLIGVEKCRNAVITNFGDADVTITSAMFTGASSSIYSVQGITLPHVLKAKGSVTVQVCATPSLAERGSNLVTLTVAGTSNEKPSVLTGTVDIIGQLACVLPAPATAFQDVMTPHNVMDSSEVTITNCGDVATAYDVTITGADAGLYSITPTTSPVVAPNGTTSFWVYFTPISSGPKPATLNFTGTAVTTTVALAGTGACAVLDPVATVTAPETPANGTNQFTMTVHNSGNLVWNPGTALITPADAFTFVSGAPIAPQSDGTITLSFNPPSWNVFTAVVSFPNAEVCGNPLEINVTGNATRGTVGEVSEAGYVLTQNNPNPVVGGTTSFSYTIPEQANVRIVLADVTGKVVRELVNSNVNAGTHGVDIQASDLASGTYLYIMEAGKVRLVRQLAISK